MSIILVLSGEPFLTAYHSMIKYTNW